MALLRGSNPTKYTSLLGHLANQYASGCDKYPKDLTTAYSTLVHYRTPSNAKQLANNTIPMLSLVKPTKAPKHHPKAEAL